MWDAGAWLTIKGASGTPVVYDGAATAEINATGKVVYGFNWQKPVAGDYTITFSSPNVMIGAADAGTVSADGHSIVLTITVAAKGGGGGGGKP